MALKDSFGGKGGGSGAAGNENVLVNKAMSFASEHFDKHGGQGTKQDAMDKAKETITKLYVKHKIHGVLGGGSSSSLDSLIDKIL